MDDRPSSIIASTGQVWKVLLGLGLLFAGSLGWITRLNDLEPLLTVISLLGFVYLCASVRCPRCGAKWIWMAVNGKLARCRVVGPK